MKLYNIPNPFDRLKPVKIKFADGTERIGKYGVFDYTGTGCVRVYDSDQNTAIPTDVFFVCDSAIESIEWLDIAISEEL